MADAVERELDLDAPIAGMSLTHEVGARPWQSPPQYNTIEEALSFYLPRIGDPNYIGQVIGLLESGTSLTTIAETMTLVGAMEGKHSIDVAVLVNPVIVEYLKGIGDLTGTEYNIDNKSEDISITPTMVEKATKELQGEKEVSEEVQTEIETLGEETLEKAKTGLMARKNKQQEDIVEDENIEEEI